MEKLSVVSGLLILAVLVFCGGSLAKSGDTATATKTVSAIHNAGPTQVRLSKTWQARLNELHKGGVEVLYPADLPKRFALKSLTISRDDGAEAGKELDYQLQFCNKSGQCISVESAASGIGDGPDGDRALHGRSKELGDFTVDVFKPGSEGNCTKVVYYLSSWIEYPSPKTEHHKTSIQSRYYHALGNGISDKEAVAIVESLEPLR